MDTFANILIFIWFLFVVIEFFRYIRNPFTFVITILIDAGILFLLFILVKFCYIVYNYHAWLSEYFNYSDGMIIEFKEDTELEVIHSYDEENDNIGESNLEVFKAGVPVEADITSTSESGLFVDLQFGDGSIATSVQKESFTIKP